jgi:hypothetical protein
LTNNKPLALTSLSKVCIIKSKRTLKPHTQKVAPGYVYRTKRRFLSRAKPG